MSSSHRQRFGYLLKKSERSMPEEVIPSAKGTGSRLTPAEFQNWKAQKGQLDRHFAEFSSAWSEMNDADASVRKAEAARRRAEDLVNGSVQMNGRELFLHEPWVFDSERF